MTTSAPSRGQLAYEEFRSSEAHRRPGAVFPRWHELTDAERDGWQASADGPVSRRAGPQPVLPAPVPEPVRTELPATAMEETVSPVSAALAAVQHQAAALERDVAANPLAVVITARHVGKAFTHAECIAITDFIAAVEAERRTQADGQSRTAAAVAVANGNGSRLTGPQQVLA